jgi:hypothetical protein
VISSGLLAYTNILVFLSLIRSSLDEYEFTFLPLPKPSSGTVALILTQKALLGRFGSN